MRKMIYDLHTHTRYSSRCGVVEPEQLVKTAILKGLDGIAVTDHDTIEGAVEARKFETPEFKVIIGCEIKTTSGELIGLFLQEEIESREPIEVIREIHAQGGIVVVPHPFDRFRSSRFDLLNEILKHVDAIEVFNSRCISNKSNELARNFVIKHTKTSNISMVGGSDAHYLGEVGRGYTKISDTRDVGKSDTADWVKYAFQDGKIDGMGCRSPLVNHLRTKLHKWSKSCVNR